LVRVVINDVDLLLRDKLVWLILGQFLSWLSRRLAHEFMFDFFISTAGDIFEGD